MASQQGVQYRSLFGETVGQVSILKAGKIETDALLAIDVIATGDITVGDDLTVTNDIIVGGLVDGVDVAALKTQSDDNVIHISHLDSTTMLKGGILTFVDATHFAISDGECEVVDNTTDVDNPVTTSIPFSGFSNVLATEIAGGPLTHISIDVNGAIIQSNTDPSNSQHRSQVHVGTLTHYSTSITSVLSQPAYFLSPALQFHDFATIFGYLNVSGNTITPNGVNLNIDKSAGDIYGEGINYDVDLTDPSIKTVPLFDSTISTFTYQTQLGVSSTTNTVDVLNYDLGGVVTALTGNKWTIQRVFLDSTGTPVMQLGQTVYNSLQGAKDSIVTDVLVVSPLLQQQTILLAYIIVNRNTTDLSDVTKNFFSNVGLFGAPVGTATTGATLQSAYDNSLSGTIVTDATRDGVEFQIGSGADTDKALVVSNTAGTEVFAVTGEGVVTLSSTIDGVDLLAFKTDYDSKIDQSLLTTSTPTFVNLTLSGGFLNENIQLPDGSAASPSLHFENDIDTGLYLALAGIMGISVGGLIRAFFSATSFELNVPIVTTSVVDGVDIASTIETSNALLAASSPTFVGLTLSSDLITSSTIDGVDIASTIETSNALLSTSSPTFVDLTMGSGTVSLPSYGFGADSDSGMYYDTTASNTSVGIAYGGVDHLRVGLLNSGTTDPVQGVQINSVSPEGGIMIQASTDSVSAGINFMNTDGKFTSTIQRQGTAEADLVFSCSAKNTDSSTLTERLRIHHDGGITLSTPLLTPIELPTGTALLPSYTFDTDLNTGMYRLGTDRFGFSTAGTLRLEMNTARIQSSLQIRNINGTAAVPSYAFSNDANSGMYRYASDWLGFSTGATAACVIDSNQNFLPVADNTKTLGGASNRWSEVFAGNATINTSDEAEKHLISKSELSLDFINRLKPKKWKWRETEDEGKKREGKRYHHGLVAQDIKATLDDMKISSNDFSGYVATPKKEYNRVKVTKKDEFGVDYDDYEMVESLTGETTYGLRYSSFIAPLINAVQELSIKCAALEERLRVLET